MLSPQAYVRHRFAIGALLFFAASINYLDRQVLAILSALPGFHAYTGVGTVEYGYLNSVFYAAYAVALPLWGRLCDRIGTRAGFALVMGVWSLAGIAHAFARGLSGFVLARIGLGAGEAGNFPAAIKSVAAWFDRRDRALVTGIFNAGTSLGAVVAPLLVPFVYARLGWRACFIVTGLLGAIWIVAWLALPRPPAAPAADAPTTPWRALLRDPRVLTIAAAKLLTDPIWWFYLAWLPRFFAGGHGVGVTTLGLPLAIVYLVSDLGSVGGGWLPRRLVLRGWSIPGARRAVMLGCALAVTPMALARPDGELAVLVLLTALATAAHQAWSANLYSLVSDRFPTEQVGSVVGLVGAAGSVGGILLSAAAGHVVAAAGFRPLFLLAGGVYLVAWVILWGRPRR